MHIHTTPSRVSEILAEQKAHDAKLAADAEAARLARADGRLERLRLEKLQDEVRFTNTKLMAKLWATPRAKWNEEQAITYAMIVERLAVMEGSNDG